MDEMIFPSELGNVFREDTVLPSADLKKLCQTLRTGKTGSSRFKIRK